MNLFNLLLTKLMFAGTMFFAAGDMSMGGSGGGDAGTLSAGTDAGNADAGTGGDTGVGSGDGAGATDAGAGDSASGDRQAADQQLDAGTADPSQTQGGIPTKYADTFKQFPELKSLWFSQNALRTAGIPSVKAAIEEHKALEAIGGADGIQALQADVQDFQKYDKLYSENPQQWVSELFTADAEQGLKAFGAAWDHVKANHPEQAAHISAQNVWDALQSQESPLYEIFDLLKANAKDPTVKMLANKLAEWHNKFEKDAKTVPVKAADPKAEQLNQREAKIKEQEQTQTARTISAQTVPYLQKGVQTSLETAAKAAGANLEQFKTTQPGAYTAMLAEIDRQVRMAAIKDHNFVANHKSARDSGQIDRAVQMQNKKHDAIVPAIVQKVAKEWGLLKTANGNGNGQQTNGTNRGTNNSGNSNGIKRVSAPPSRDQIDYSKTIVNGVNMMFDDKAVLKDGTIVTWAKI